MNLSRFQTTLLFVGSVALLLAVAWAGIAMGSVRLPLREVAIALLHPSLISSDQAVTIVRTLRLPRVLAAALCGAGLAAAGVGAQALLRNPLADPYTMGVSSGAALFAVAGLLATFLIPAISLPPLPVLAMTGAALTFAAIYVLVGAQSGGIYLLLAGVVVGSFCSAFIALLELAAQRATQELLFWLMGGFSTVSWQTLVWLAPLLVWGGGWLAYLSDEMDLLIQGEEAAHSAGVRVRSVQWQLFGAVSLLVGAMVAASGMIGFVGLIVPHAARLIVGGSHRRLLPMAALWGATFLVLIDLVARSILPPAELPVGAITAFLGAPFFLYLLRHRRVS
ncbi:MAG: iron ABC transporter permease [Firmicutes bacterium]|nr:iron ABC transporter permease [Bacillota bacterium]